MAHQSALRADVIMMPEKEAVTVICMITAITDITAPAPQGQEAIAVRHPPRAAHIQEERAAIRPRAPEIHIHRAAVLHTKIIVPTIPTMKAIMPFMKMMIMIGTATGVMMTMQQVLMMQWKMRIGKNPGN